MRQRTFILYLLAALGGGLNVAQAQRTVIYDDKVKTVQLRVNDNTTNRLPVLRLNSSDILQVSFDELSHDYHRYTYKIEHLDADFQTEDGLFESDYMEATADEGLIEDYTQSMNTSVIYTHYTLTLPNAYMRPLLSGNYALTVYSDDEGEPHPVLKTFFYIAEETVSVATTGTTNTDIDRNKRHQQQSISLNRQNLVLRDPAREIKVIVLQNNRWDNAVVAPPPTGQSSNTLTWDYCKALIFEAGNEYRKFEIQSTRYPGLHIDKVGYYDPFYHITLMPDEPRKNYLYDEDQNGGFVALANSGTDADVEADYVWVHFSLAMPELPAEGSRLFVNGTWTYDDLLPQYEMAYNPQSLCYEAALLLKQGYYSYQYLTMDAEGKTSVEPTEGSYYQTENNYTFLVYYRQTGSRYDRLVGWRSASYRP